MQQLTNGTLLQGGKYKIERVLGQGGFGITYLATVHSSLRKVAIKEFFFKQYCGREENTSNVYVPLIENIKLVSKFRAKFLKEAITLKGLNHKNIVKVYESFEENNTAYYVMEYVDGSSLKKMLDQRGAIGESEAIGYINQVADALEYIHARRIMHLDIKPDNIMLGNNGQVTVIDFGVSKLYDDTGNGLTYTTPVGTSKGYSPFEQTYDGGVSSFSPQSDVYALAATLYKLLSGVTPPPSPEVKDFGLPTDVLLNRNISTNVVNTIVNAMKTQSVRTQSVKEFMRQLDDDSTVVLDEATEVKDTNNKTNPDVPKSSKDRSSNMWVAIILLIGVVIVIAFAMNYSNSEQHQSNEVIESGQENGYGVNENEETVSDTYSVKSVDSFVSRLSSSAKILGRNSDNTKVYYMTGSTNNYTLHVYNANTDQSTIIDYENVSEDFYLYIYKVSQTKVVNHHLYVISETGASSNGESNSVFYIDMNDDQVYYFDSGDNAYFTNNGKVSLTKKIVTNYNTANCAADYEYEFHDEVKSLR